MKQIRNVAVCGLGTMGHGIVQAFAVAGLAVRGYDNEPAARRTLHERIRTNLLSFAEAKLVKRRDIDSILKRIVACENEADAVRDAQVVAECVAEDIAVKQQWFSRVERLVSKNAILASNSSTFPISLSGAGLEHPQRAIVMHWFNPPHIVPVVEVVPGPRTSEATTQAALRLLKRIDKTPIRINQELPGFLVNRVQVALIREVWDLVDRGIATPADIDRAIRGTLGFRLAVSGPLEVNDFGGLDILSRVFLNLAPEICSSTKLPRIVKRLLEGRHLGAKTGKGFHRYTPKTLAIRKAQRDRGFLELFGLIDPSRSSRIP